MLWGDGSSVKRNAIRMQVARRLRGLHANVGRNVNKLSVTKVRGVHMPFLP